MMAVAGVSFGHRKKDALVQNVKSRLDAVYLKLDESLIGATLEIVRETGEVVITEAIVKRQVLIDFFYETPGFYKIRIVRDDVVELEYEYVNTSLVAENEEGAERLVVMQGVKYTNRHHRKIFSHLITSTD